MNFPINTKIITNAGMAKIQILTHGYKKYQVADKELFIIINIHSGTRKIRNNAIPLIEIPTAYGIFRPNL